MRKFSSYGPIDKDIHFYVPREERIKNAYMQLTGENPEKGGHYITVWAPRQTGKTWVMQQVVKRIREHGAFEFGIITMQSAKYETKDEDVLDVFVSNMSDWFGKPFENITTLRHLRRL
ncbi:MAG: hypothetical protein GY749_23015, partial [Desulfobacteraceae bacterium]|nr:hypothetical protein [Desulfobacteraceae bacterium]